jgi:predicted NBD/HSP70 family sugar kinase
MLQHPPAAEPRGHATADTQAMRQFNSAVVVRRLWHDIDGLSRADLARILGLSRSTVSAIVEELLARGVVVESHLAESTGGRRPIVLRFHDEHRHVVGLDMGASHITTVRTDLRGRVLARDHVDFDVQGDPHGALSAIDEAASRVLAVDGPPLLGVGVGVPCPVDAASISPLSPRIMPAWVGVRLPEWLSARFGTRIFLDNDANVGALAEAWWGAGRGVSHFAYLKVGTGVGAGFVIDGAVYRGTSGIAGEIGHASVNPVGRQCRCGLSGCLEAEIGSPAILDKVREALASGAASSLVDDEHLDLRAVLRGVADGDPVALAVVEGAGEHLGVAIANLLNLLNPGRIVLGGRLTQAGEHLLAPLRRTVQRRALSTSIEHAEIALGRLAEDHVAIGAATLVLQHALDDPRPFSSPARPVGPLGAAPRVLHTPS